MASERDEMENGIALIAAERQRQINVEGWTPEHDDGHDWEAMAWAAVCYAAPGLVYRQEKFANEIHFKDPWPWEETWDKRPHHGNVVQPNDPVYVNRDDRIRQLSKAGALIAAEIDRLQRAKLTTDPTKGCRNPPGNKHRSILRADGSCPGCDKRTEPTEEKR